MTHKILSVAHRGYSARYPENTTASALAAIAAGADLVEADVRLSSDGVAFSVHDPDLNRLTGRALVIAETPAAEIRAATRHDGGEMAEFPQIVAAVAGNSGLLIDTKLGGPDILATLHGILSAAGWPTGIWLGLRRAEQVAEARKLFGTRVSILGFMPDIAEAREFLAAGANALRLWEGDLDHPDAAELRKLAPIWVTAGEHGGHKVGDTDAAGLARIRAFGPAAVLLNDPTLLKGGG